MNDSFIIFVLTHWRRTVIQCVSRLPHTATEPNNLVESRDPLIYYSMIRNNVYIHLTIIDYCERKRNM